MTTWLLIIGALWLLMLVLFSLRSYRKTETAHDYIFAGSSVGTLIGLMTFAATLFSTFTLMGMPDFFRVHGVGAWIFLAVSDAVMFFLILAFGFHLRQQARERGYRGVAGLLCDLYGANWAGYVYLAGILIFLVPYVAIQIRGIAIFLSAIFPEALPAWGWSTAIVAVMLMYSEVGGLRAIIYSDVMQGTILLVVLWIIGVSCVVHFGGIGEMFQTVKSVDPALLSTPGPQGLFTFQFLVASFFAIVLIPVTQPQVTTRLVIMRNKEKMHRMAVSLGVFTALILLPVIAIGMYGAVYYGEATTREFLSQVLLFERTNIVAATVVIGLIAAAVSTSDSQLFALGTEVRSLLSGKERHILLVTRGFILLFGVLALAVSLVSSDELVLLARDSFAGTAIMGPLIISAIFSKRAPGTVLIGATGLGLLAFLLSRVNLFPFPDTVMGVRLDLFLFAALTLIAVVSVLLEHFQGDSAIGGQAENGK